MTYRELAKLIESLTEEQKNMDVTRFDSNDGEFYRLGALSITYIADENVDVLGAGHPFLEAWSRFIEF